MGSEKQALRAALANLKAALLAQSSVNTVRVLALDLTKAEINIVADAHLDGWPLALELDHFVRNIDQLIRVDGLVLTARAQGALDVLNQRSRQQMQQYRRYTLAMQFI